MTTPSWIKALVGWPEAAKQLGTKLDASFRATLAARHRLVVVGLTAVQDAIDALSSTEDPSGASTIGLRDANNLLVATNVEDAIEELAAGGGAANVVVWAPDQEESTDDYVVTWAEAVARVQAMSAPTTIKIQWQDGEDASDPVILPGGTWELNETTIDGVAFSADTDTQFRGYQNLVYVAGEGDPANPTWLKGCVGLKNMFFRQSDYESSAVNGTTGAVTANEEGVVTFTTVGASYEFSSKDVGKPIRIGYIEPYNTYGDDVDNSDNRGTFVITAVVDASTIQFENGDGAVDANNGTIGWSLCTSTFIVTPSDFGTNLVFTLDNVDFHFGGDYDWGSFYIMEDVDQFIRLTNAASIRWFGLIVDGYLVVQSDGGGSWVGSLAFCGNGFVDVFPMAGTQVRSWQTAIAGWTVHQPIIQYIAADLSKWTSETDTIHESLDQLASRVYALEHP